MMRAALFALLPLVLATPPGEPEEPEEDAPAFSWPAGRHLAVGAWLGSGEGVLAGVEVTGGAGPFELAVFADQASRPTRETGMARVKSRSTFQTIAFGGAAGLSSRLWGHGHLGVAVEGGLTYARSTLVDVNDYIPAEGDYAVHTDSTRIPYAGGRLTLGLHALDDRALFGLMVALRAPVHEETLSARSGGERVGLRLVIAVFGRFRVWRS